MPEHPTVSVDEIARRLHFTRNHIYKAMLPYIKHEKNRKRIQVDEEDLRQWLMKNASFSRQTKFLDDYDEPAQREYIAMLTAYGLAPKGPGRICPPPAQRSKLPFRNVYPFDFWDKELVFTDDPRFNNAESFYRAMFESAAIKIKLGERKTIFYAPSLEAVLRDKNGREIELEGYTDINSVTGKTESFCMPATLYPAIDAEKEEEYYRKLNENYPPVVIRIEGHKSSVEQVRKTLLASGIYTFSKDIEESRSASGNTLCLKIPQPNLDYWSENMAKMEKITDIFENRFEQEQVYPEIGEE